MNNFKTYESLLDVFFLSIVRILSVTIPIAKSYKKAQPPPPSPFLLYHPNGDKKTKSELEEEALEESFRPWFIRYTKRPSFPCELICYASIVFDVTKCLIRLNVEIGVFNDKIPHHSLWWIYMIFFCIFSVIDIILMESMVIHIGLYSQFRKKRQQIKRTSSGISLSVFHDRDMEHDFYSPLLEQNIHLESPESETIYSESSHNDEDQNLQNMRGISDISSDAEYKTTINDLFSILYQDLHIIAIAFVFLLGAAAAQIFIPQFTGNILDALTENADNLGYDNQDDGNIVWNIPGFISNTKKLIIAALICGVCSGIRGALFTLVSEYRKGYYNDKYFFFYFFF